MKLSSEVRTALEEAHEKLHCVHEKLHESLKEVHCLMGELHKVLECCKDEEEDGYPGSDSIG